MSQPPVASQLSATLAHAVANSGLFYESHLAQLTAGTRTLAQLMQEPQARLEASVKLAPVAQTGQVAQAAPGAVISAVSVTSGGPSAQAAPAGRYCQQKRARQAASAWWQCPALTPLRRTALARCRRQA